MSRSGAFRRGENAVVAPDRARGHRAFTLVELLVTIGIIAVLISVLLPVLGRAKRESNRAFCLNNIRSMQLAQLQYANDHNGYLIQAGLGHRGVAINEDVTWVNTLREYYGGSSASSDGKYDNASGIVSRCPSDDSPHWPGGVPVPASNPPAFRRTSYGINEFLDRDLCPWGPKQSTDTPPGGWYSKITRVRRPSVTVQFLEMARHGEFAAADHPHVENWTGSNPPAIAARQMEVGAHGGPRAGWDSMANYGFLDGHAESLRFREVFRDLTKFNRFDPSLAR
jgi:prepilin-type N-terminal cleavage/methylation domain-containing protein/prepilin-type processing-associated H-X9-DG protein